MSDPTPDRWLSPAQAAERLGHCRAFVVKLLLAGELVARDERGPGAKLARYKIDPRSIDAWTERRRLPPPEPPPLPVPCAPVLRGVLTEAIARRGAWRAAREVKAAAGPCP